MKAENSTPGTRVEQPVPVTPSFTASHEGTWDAETLTLVLRQAMSCLDGESAMVHRRDPADGRLRLVAADGLASADAEACSVLSAEQEVALARAARHDAFVWTGGDAPGAGESGMAAVPLRGSDGLIGVLSVVTADSGEPDEARRSLLHAVAGWAGARLGGEAGQPGAAPVAGTERSSVRMGELTAALAETLTTRDVAAVFARYVMSPFGADGLMFQVFDGGRLRMVAATGYSREFLEAAGRIPVSERDAAVEMVQAHVPRFIESRAEFAWRFPALRQLNDLSPKESWAFLPMVASGRVAGLCVVSFSEPRSFSEEERTLLTALSGLVGQALERARLYDVEHARAQELQRGLLPKTLPRLPAVSAAARYLPAGLSEDVGGDWYDLIPLSADRVAIVIGDVMGHGITEAATMGRLRTAVRTLADLDMPPDEVFARLNDLVSDLGMDSYATCLYAVFDPVARTCTYSLAGHPPPVVVHPDGTVSSPDLVPDPPLGAAGPPFELHRMRLPDESLLVLCTDGLVETADRDTGQGLTQLRQILSRTVTGAAVFEPSDPDGDVRHLEELCDTVVSALLPDRGQTNDDACLLIAHARCTAPGDVVSCSLPEDPRAAGQAREYVRKQLAAWGLDELTVTTELLVSEMVGNVVRHAKGPIRLRLLRSRFLTCEVYDGSLTTPRIRHAAHTDEGGRGLQLVAALCRRWGARYLQDGKCIWTEQELPHPERGLGAGRRRMSGAPGSEPE